MPQGIDEEKEAAVEDVPFLRHESQEHGQDGHGARRRDDAEEQIRAEMRRDAPCFFTFSPAGTGKLNLRNPSRWSPMTQADAGDEVLPERADVAEHPAHQGGDEPEDGEGDGQAQDEEKREDERALERRRLLVPGDDAHQERDHGQDAGIQGRRHAAEEDGDDRQPGAVLEELPDVAE